MWRKLSVTFLRGGRSRERRFHRFSTGECAIMPFHMKTFRLVACVALLSVCPGLGSRPMSGAASTLDLLQSELQRNFQVLKQQETPAYYLAYTVHDERSAQ